MDRGRQGSVIGADTKRKENPSAGGGYGELEVPAALGKFGGSIVAATLQEESRMIDPNLLVGPLYVPKTNRSDSIKEQLGDITEKLHKTLYAFDDFADFEHGVDPTIGLMRQQIGSIEDTEVKNNLAHFMDQYQGMSIQVTEANKEREDMLLQLADWFTTDHVDLDDIKTSLDETEEESMKHSYFDTITNFEKLKNLKTKILTQSGEGKSTRQLKMAKVELEKDVVDKFKKMKDMSMQTMKLKVSDNAPWTHAAQDIVSMLRNVRTENSDELQAIHKKMQDMVDQLEKQALFIKALKAELRDKKEVCKKLTDENGDLSQDVALFRARTKRFEKDLEQAKQMLKSLNQDRMTDKDAADYALSQAQGKTLKGSISKPISQIDDSLGELKRTGSDSLLLRTQLRELQDALDCIKGEYSRSAEDVDELTIELKEKREYIADMEKENEKLTKDIKILRQERRQSIAVGALIPPPGEGHQCEHCKCHIQEPEDSFEEIDELKAEVKKWQDKCNYFKKCLADTELKLSAAYKDISDLRMERNLSPPPQPAKRKEEPQKATQNKLKESPAAAPSAAPVPKPEKPDQPDTEGNERQFQKPKPKPKPKREVKPRYLQQSTRQPERKRLSPIEQQQVVDDGIEDQIAANLDKKQNRELKLYKAGDIQGKLNMLVTEIMEFVSEIGKLLYKEKEGEKGKIQSIKAFTFENNTGGKKDKEVRDQREEEAKMKKSQVICNGQHACSILREAFDCLSSSMELQHNEYEDIYRSFKLSQQRNAIRREVIMGRLPGNALQEFDRKQFQTMQDSGKNNLLSVYYNISYGGTTGFGSVNKPMHMLAAQKSRSDIDKRDAPTSNSVFGSLASSGLFRERSQLSLSNTHVPSRIKETSTQPNKKEIKIGVAMVPRKGAIGLLQSTDTDILYEAQVPLGIHGGRNSSVFSESDTDGKGKRRSFIKNKGMLEHIKIGNKMLEESEETKYTEEEMESSLGDYTILDLQSKLLEMTDSNSIKRQTPTMGNSRVTSSQPSKRLGQVKMDKAVTLPNIKNFNPFDM